jgi:hypothetical protein
MDEGRKRAAAIQWAERIMQKIDKEEGMVA